jgi:ubiquinol-cytochrome c reductase cytochrome c1 subunit
LSEAQIVFTDSAITTGVITTPGVGINAAGTQSFSASGALPPDLSLATRARSSHSGTGSDWVYTYLRSYYRDATRATGWNNAVFPAVGMPHVFWELQGSRGATIEEIKANKDEKSGSVVGFTKTLITFDTQGQRTERTEKLDNRFLQESSVVRLGPAAGGKLTQAQYDENIADLVAYMTYMADPSAKSRVRLGVWVLLFLSIFTVLAWWLNREFWKDVK